MITKWKLFNFKSVRNETEFALGPLTIFAGPNSSGKSTVLQSMLLISQTLASRVSSRSVILNGPLTKLGQFDDLRSFGSEADQILIGWETTPLADDNAYQSRLAFGRRRRLIKHLACEISFDVDSASHQRDLLQLIPSLFGCKISITSLNEDNLDQVSALTITRSGLKAEKIKSLEIEDTNEEIPPTSLDYDVEIDAESTQELQEGLTSFLPIGCAIRHFLPFRLISRYDKREEKAQLITSGISETYYRPASRRREFETTVVIPTTVIELLRKEIGDELIGLIIPTSNQLSLFGNDGSPEITLLEWFDGAGRLSPPDRNRLRRTLQEREPGLGEQIRSLVMGSESKKYGIRTSPLPPNLSEGIRYFEHLFASEVSYLGPLRDEPKPLYPLATTIDPSDIGLKGEFTAAVLNLNKDRRINYIPSQNFSNPEVKLDTVTRSLEAAVIDWLQYLGVAEQLSTQDRGKLGHELKVTTPGTTVMHDLTHVGVGISQVLPILVMCLLAEPDTTIIIEQPELHLHPKVQTLLADFFLSMALLGKQCVVETHSEYIISRLRFRSASALEDTISRLLQIYFVEKRDGASQFRTIDVNKYGAIPDWPDGFFDQSQDEAEQILMAATLKRKKEKWEQKNAQRHD